MLAPAITKVKRAGGIGTFHLVPINTAPINGNTDKFPLLSFNSVNIDTALALGGGWSAAMPGVITIPPFASNITATCHQDWATQRDAGATNSFPFAGYHLLYEGTCASDYVIGAVNNDSGTPTGEDNFHIHVPLPLTPNASPGYFNMPPPLVLEGSTFPVFAIPMVDLGGGTATFNLDVAGYGPGDDVVIDEFINASYFLGVALTNVPIPANNIKQSGQPNNAADFRLWVPLPNDAWGFGKGPDYIRVNISAISNMTIAGASTPGTYILPRVGMRITFPLYQDSGVDLVMGAGPFSSATVVSHFYDSLVVPNIDAGQVLGMGRLIDGQGFARSGVIVHFRQTAVAGVGLIGTKKSFTATSNAQGNLQDALAIAGDYLGVHLEIASTYEMAFDPTGPWKSFPVGITNFAIPGVILA